MNDKLHRIAKEQAIGTCRIKRLLRKNTSQQCTRNTTQAVRCEHIKRIVQTGFGAPLNPKIARNGRNNPDQECRKWRHEASSRCNSNQAHHNSRRNANRRKDETKEYKMRHRFYVDLGYGKKLGFVKLENRLRYQHQYKDNDGVTEFDASYFRDKIEVSFPNKSKFTPYISNDFFINTSTGFDQIRPKVGVGYKFNKKHALDLGAFKDYDVVGTEKYSPVLVVNYKFKF